MPWTLREHQSEPDRLAHLLYWQELLRDGEDVVYQNNDSLLSVLRYRGPDMESADAHELMAARARLHQAVFLPLKAGWMGQTEERKHLAAPYQASPWRHPVAAFIDEERRAQVGTPGTHFETSYYVTLTQQIPRRLGSWWQRLWWEHIPQGHAQTDAVASFREDIQRVTQQLTSMFDEVELLTGSAVLAYLKSTVSEHVQPSVAVPEPPWYLNYQLTDTPVHVGVTPRLGAQWLRPVLVKNAQRQVGFPETTYPGILDVLHDLGVEYRYTERWIPLSYAKARRELNRLENLFRGQHKSTMTQLMERFFGKDSAKVEEAADTEAEAMSAARASLESGTCAWGHLSIAVLVWDSDFSMAEQKREAVEHALRARGFLAAVEQIDAFGAWLSMVPGDSYHNVEKPLLHSLNAVDLMPTTSVWAGPEWVPHLHGPPWFVGTARGQTPFRVTTHEGDCGDFLMCGPKGSGKSALAAFMCAQWQRYQDARVRALDKGSSLKALTMAMEGNWVEVAPQSARPLQPLARIDDDAERAWAGEWVGDLLEMDGMVRTAEATEEVWASLQALTDFPPRHRTLSGLVGLIQSRVMRQALGRYTVAGPFGFLDGDEDWLHLSEWDCFEMEKLLDDYPRLVPPVFSLLARRIEAGLTGEPTFIPIDECHAYFGIEAVAKRQLGWLKTFRRRNAVLGFLTQNLLDLTRCPVGEELLQAAPTRFLLPNPHALEPDIMRIFQGLGLSRRQCELIATAVPKRDAYYMGQQGTRLFRLEMGPVTLAFCGRSRQADLARLAQVDRERTEPMGVAWLRSEGREDLANLLREGYADDKDQAVLQAV
jgi:type IV secretion system protein TrbE